VPRGALRQVGDRFTNQNGYTYEKTTARGWVAVHILIAEDQLERALKPEERATFKDGNRHNLDPSNIVVVIKYSKQSAQAKLVRIEEQIRELQAQAEEIRKEIDNA